MGVGTGDRWHRLDCLESIRVANFTQFEGRAVAHRKSILAREALPNITVKLTGNPSHADDAYPFERLHPHYRAMFGAFRAVPTLAK
jgi:hypothetical protein